MRAHPFPATPVLLLLLLVPAACVTTERAVEGDAAASSEELLAQGDAHFSARKYEVALGAYKMAAVAASGEGESDRLAEAASLVAHVLAMTGEVEGAEEWLAQAEGRARKEEPVSWARLLLARGAVAQAAGDAPGARDSFESAWRFAVESEQPVRAVQAAHMSSVVSQGLEQVRWTRRALDAGQELGDDRLVSQLWGQLAWLLEEEGLADEALEAFQRGRAAALHLKDEHLTLVADWSLGHGLRMVGRTAEARALLEDVARRADRAYLERRRPNDAEWVGHAQRELAELDLVDGQRRRARSRLQRAHDHLIEAGAADLAPDVLRAVRQRIAELEPLPSSASNSP